MDGILNLLDGGATSSVSLYCSLVSCSSTSNISAQSSSAWSSAGWLPIIPSYTSQPPLKIFSVLTQKYVIRQNTTAHICFVQNVLPSLTSGVCRRCRSWWSCVKCSPQGLRRQFLAPGEDSDGGEVGRRGNRKARLRRHQVMHLSSVSIKHIKLSLSWSVWGECPEYWHKRS